MEIQLNKKLFQVCTQGLEDQVFCGIAAGVSIGRKKNRFRSIYAGGKTRMDDLGRAVTTKTLFDLASLSKPLSTVLCTLHLIHRSKIDWQDPLHAFFPGAWPSIRIHHILHHASGLPAYQPYYQQFAARQSPVAAQQLLIKILDQALAYTTGTTSVYSDLGFILLGRIVELAAETDLSQLFAQKIVQPLGLANTLRYRPVGGQICDDILEVAATEYCPWRQKILQGEVHDEHCWLMGGVAGHAGLFGTIETVLALCELLLDVWKGETTHPAFSAELLRYALTKKQAHSTWCLGFDTPTPGASSSGQYFSQSSVGHLGFSGTSFWIDPEKEVIIVLLTNRIHPSRENVKIRSFRPYFHNQLMEIICGQ